MFAEAWLVGKMKIIWMLLSPVFFLKNYIITQKKKMFGPPKPYTKHRYLGCIGIVPGYLFFARKNTLFWLVVSNIFGIFTPIWGKIPHFDSYFSNGLKVETTNQSSSVAHRQNHPCIQ